MIASLKDEDGYVYAYIEWEITDGGVTLKKDGEYIYVQTLWVHEDWDGKDAIFELIPEINEHEFSHNAKWVYWNRDKYGDRVSKIFDRWKLSKKGVRYGQEE